MRKMPQCPKCNSSLIIQCEKNSLFERITKCLDYDYTCKSCGYKWDADDPNGGYNPNESSNDGDDIIVVISDVPPIF